MTDPAVKLLRFGFGAGQVRRPGSEIRFMEGAFRLPEKISGSSFLRTRRFSSAARPASQRDGPAQRSISRAAQTSDARIHGWQSISTMRAALGR